jgi:hypothetical protein
MRLFFFLIIILNLPGSCFSQASDFISVRKKNNRTLKTYFPGSAISCKTVTGNFMEGIIREVRNDSLFIQAFDVRSVPNMWGVFSVDTLGSYYIPLHYRDIEQVFFDKRNSFGFVKNGSLFMIGGIGYAALNLINGKYLDQPITEPENVKSLGIALGVAGTGYVLNRVRKHRERNGRRYQILYVRMNE